MFMADVALVAHCLQTVCSGTYGGLFANQLLVALVADCLQSDLANGGYGRYGGLSGKWFE